MKIRYTKTATFIFPLLQIPKSLFSCDVKNVFDKVILNNRFINAYLTDEKIEKYNYLNNHIFIHVNNYQNINFNSFYDTLSGFPNYVEDYERDNNLVFIFKIPDEFQEDYEILLQIGAGYSQISKDAKRLILSNHFSYLEPAQIPLILNKSIALKEYWEKVLDADLGFQEVWGMIIPEKETLTTDILKQYHRNSIKPKEEFK